MWTKDEPKEIGYYWAMRDLDLPRVEIVYVYESREPELNKMMFAMVMGSDMGAQLFEFSCWKKIQEQEVGE